MRILIIDETAGAERLSSDQSKNANIGSGTGSARISITVTAFMAPGPTLSPGRCVPLSVHPTAGSASITPGSVVTIHTSVSTRNPLVTIGQGSRSTSLELDPSDPLGRACISGANVFPQAEVDDISNGQFTVFDNDSPDPSGLGGGTCVLSGMSFSYAYL